MLWLSAATDGYAEVVSQTALPPIIRVNGDTARSAGNADVAVNAAGQAVAAWAEVPVDRTGEPRSTGAMVSFRSASGAWSTPQRVSSTAYHASNVRVTIDAAGTSTIAWTEAPDYDRETVHVVRHSDAGFADEQTFVPPTGGAKQLGLEANQRGDAVLTWEEFHPCVDYGSCGGSVSAGSDIWIATRMGNTAFGVAQQVSDPSKLERSSPVASVGTHGEVAVAWQEGTTVEMHVRVRQRVAGGTFAPAVDIPIGHVAGAAVNVIVTPGGGATVAWWEERVMKASRLAADGALSSPQTLAGRYATPFSLGRAALAVDDAGRVAAAWIANDGLWTATAAPGTDFGAAALLDGYAAANGSGGPALAADPAGGVLLAWVSDNALRAAWRPSGEPGFRATGTIRAGAYAGHPVAALAGGHALLAASFGDLNTTNVFATIGDPAQVAPPVVAPAPLPDTAAPQLKITAASVVKASKKRRGKHVAPKKVQVVVSASEAAQVVVTVSRRAVGVRRGDACVAPPARKSKRKKLRACKRSVTVGKPFPAAVPAGSTTLVLGNAPANGAYDLTLTGTDAAGNAAKPATRRLVVRAR